MSADVVDPDFAGLRFRCIGPVRGGRVLAVAGHPTDKMTFYFGACAGGIWRTLDGGAFWENISDGFLDSASVGALTVSDADPNVIYAGMGESTIRLDVSYGDGVYKSTDGGKSWQHMGLADTHHISEIRVHPKDPDLVYVAAFGHAFGPNSERGVYRSTDGGNAWELVLHKSDKAGAADLAMDPTNPRILFASIYECQRSFWNLVSGGDDSGLWRSKDGGDTWSDITRNPGLPKGMVGKIGVAVSPANPNRVWAIIENGDGVLYRSDDGGDTWAKVSDDLQLIQRPWYYCHIFADPQDPDTVYINNLKMWKSSDGGSSFDEIPTPHGDNHDLWIDPAEPQRMIQSNDGGANVSFNGGASWSSIYNQKTAQFYHVVADNHHPYHVLGTQQDNTSIAVPSASEDHVIGFGHCYPAGTGESGYIASNPEDPDIVFVGAIGSSPGGGNALQRYDHRTKQVQLVTVWPEINFGGGAEDMKYRFAWTYPIMFSPHDVGTIYAAGNHVFKTSDEGHSWEIISPDLSKAEADKLIVPGGPLTPDTSGAETYATVFALAESPWDAGVLWAGTDDGLVHFTSDGGAEWTDITPQDFADSTCVTMIEASVHDADTVFMAATRYKVDDYAPYLYKSSDRGTTWQRLDFPPDQITRCIREDPKRAGLLFVGTETGIFVSFDAGDTWQRLQGGGDQNHRLPVVPVYDMVIKGDDLVVGTHGRSFWILDDISALRNHGSGSVLVPPSKTMRRWQTWMGNTYSGPGKRRVGFGAPVTNYESLDEFGEMHRHVLDGGENPPNGAVLYYRLDGAVDPASVTLTFRSSDGEELRSFCGKPIDHEPDDDTAPERFLSTERGLNRFVWDLRVADCVKPDNDAAMKKERTGPRVAPGTYHVELAIGGQAHTASFDVVAEPGVPASDADLVAQYDLLQSINRVLGEIHSHVNDALAVVDQLDVLERSLSKGRSDTSEPDDVEMEAARVKSDISAVLGRLVDVNSHTGARLRHPVTINGKLLALTSVVASADAAPTVQSVEAFDDFAGRAQSALTELARLIADDVANLNERIRGAELPGVLT